MTVLLLKPGQYGLEDARPNIRAHRFSRDISKRIRAEVLERNGYTCQPCGAAAAELDDLNPGCKVRLRIGHIVAKGRKGTGESLIPRALCSSWNQWARNITHEPPSWMWLLAKIRRASISDQAKALELSEIYSGV